MEKIFKESIREKCGLYKKIYQLHKTKLVYRPFHLDCAPFDKLYNRFLKTTTLITNAEKYSVKSKYF